jgi:ribosome-associated protein
MNNPSEISSQELAIMIAQACDDKQGSDVVVLPVGDVLAVTEFFVVTSAQSGRQVRSIADNVLENVRILLDRSPLRTEGSREQQWILIDYGDVVVHVFAEETRRFYEIERLYRDVEPLKWRESVA